MSFIAGRKKEKQVFWKGEYRMSANASCAVKVRSCTRKDWQGPDMYGQTSATVAVVDYACHVGHNDAVKEIKERNK